MTLDHRKIKNKKMQEKRVKMIEAVDLERLCKTIENEMHEIDFVDQLNNAINRTIMENNQMDDIEETEYQAMMEASNPKDNKDNDKSS